MQRVHFGLGIVLMHASLDYCLAPFVLLHATKGLTVWASVGYAGHAIPVAVLVAVQALKALGWAGKQSPSAADSPVPTGTSIAARVAAAHAAKDSVGRASVSSQRRAGRADAKHD